MNELSLELEGPKFLQYKFELPIWALKVADKFIDFHNLRFLGSIPQKRCLEIGYTPT